MSLSSYNPKKPHLKHEMNDEKTFLTPAAHKKLSDELHQLTTEGRSEIEERIAEARSHGDLKENAEYDAAKDAQGLMEARIRHIKHLLETAEVRTVEQTDRVEVGSVVTVVDADGDEMEYLVAPKENKVPGMALVSPTSPLGAALVGASVDDDVSYQAPAGVFTIRVRSVRPYEG